MIIRLIEHEVYPKPWSVLDTTCGEPLCTTIEHIIVIAPTRIAYPSGLCVYCGRSAGTRDHIMPRTVTGEAVRRSVPTVPACGQCNSIINDSGVYSINGRRALAHKGIRRKYKKLLAMPEYSDEDLAEYGDGLRPFIEQSIVQREQVLARLSWPEDPDYDHRYLGKSEIPDPYATGLLEYL